MEPKQLLFCKEKLLKMKHTDEELLEQEDHFESTELASFDITHPGDNATDLVIQTTEMAIDEFREDEIDKIEEALQAIDNGTYGKCKVCGKTIPYERLEIVPTTLTCVEHSEAV